MKAKKKDYDYEQMAWLKGTKTLVREGSYSRQGLHQEVHRKLIGGDESYALIVQSGILTCLHPLNNADVFRDVG